MLTLVRKFSVNAPSPLLLGLAGVIVFLCVGTLVAVVASRTRNADQFKDLGPRMASWWVMVGLLTAGLALGWRGTALLFAAISFLALREFLSLAPARREDRLVIAVAYLTIPVSYVFVFANIYMFYLVFIPVYIFLALPFMMACIGQTRGYLASTASFHWALVTCVYNIGFIPLLMRLPRWDAPQAGAVGLVFMLLLATEANDVFQYIAGRLFGRRKITPRVSPNKTWEGFIGGWLATAALILLAGPVYTPLRGVGLWTVAFCLPVAGFAGDVTFSAIKRDIGVKDASGLIPGHGGLLDRLDSLTFTAPLYFHLLAYFSLATY
jgi:phosphatidate cytidylyltransferase